MIDDEEAFFTAGLIHYGTAVRAITDFKEVLYARLTHWVGQHQWRTFVPCEEWRSELSRYAKESEFYVSIGVPGRFEQDECKFEIGFSWPQGDSSKLAVYVGLHGSMPWRKKLVPTNTLTRHDVGMTAYFYRDVGPATWKVVSDPLADEFETAACKARAT